MNFLEEMSIKPVIIESDKNLSGKIIEVKIQKGNQNTFFGEISHKPKIERKDFAA